jgi:hypothetical protein
MAVARCPKCHSPKIKVTKPGLAWNSLICESCEHPFKRLSQTLAPTAVALFSIRKELGDLFDDVKRSLSDPTPEARAPLPPRRSPAAVHLVLPGDGQTLHPALNLTFDEHGRMSTLLAWRVWRLDRPWDLW